MGGATICNIIKWHFQQFDIKSKYIFLFYIRKRIRIEEDGEESSEEESAINFQVYFWKILNFILKQRK